MGCWGDSSWDRAINGGHTYYTYDVIDRCHDQATENGNTVFGVEYYIECYTAAVAELTYKKHGPKTNCKDGVGGDWALDVYKIVSCPPGITICCMKVFSNSK